MKCTYPVILLATITVSLSACEAMNVDGESPASQETMAPGEPNLESTEAELKIQTYKPLQPKLKGVLQTLGQRRCPDGSPPNALSYKTCIGGLEYNCTEYWCKGANGQPVLMNTTPNPSCYQNFFQTSLCKNEYSMPNEDFQF